MSTIVRQSGDGEYTIVADGLELAYCDSFAEALLWLDVTTDEVWLRLFGGIMPYEIKIVRAKEEEV